jgi:hypothetical protein
MNRVRFCTFAGRMPCWAVRRFTMPSVIRLVLATVIGGVLVVVGLDFVGSNRYGVLVVGLVSMSVIGYIARDPFR